MSRTPKPSLADTAIEALAQALAPRVTELVLQRLREQRDSDEPTEADVDALLAELGFRRAP